MAAVFFISGLAFFILGFAVAFYPKNNSAFKLSEHLYLIAGFGLVHGVGEWLNMFLLIEPFTDAKALVLARALALPVSFICLVQFGARAIPLNRPKFAWLRPAAPVLWMIWLGAFLSGPRDLLMWDIWSRYVLCLPGAVLAGWALALQLPHLKAIKHRDILAGMKIASVSFFLYAVTAGLVVEKADFFPASHVNYSRLADYLAIPVQVFRSACAVAMAYGLIRVLSIFTREMNDRIRQSDFRFQTIADKAPVMFFKVDNEGRVVFIQGKALGELGLPMESIVGRPVEEAFAQTPVFAEQCRRACETEAVTTIEIRGRTFEMFVGPDKEAEGRSTGVVGVAVDITQRARLHMENDQSRRELANMRKMAELGTLARGLSRQLEESFGGVRVFLRQLLRGLNENASAESLYKHVRECLREIKKSDDILNSLQTAVEDSAAAVGSATEQKEDATEDHYAVVESLDVQGGMASSNSCGHQLA
ncbi:MAG: PAS domain-containing protein [Phycisphaerae bacterium]|nr:PAS domain-containing protein [Phycisphaerae bacterium]